MALNVRGNQVSIMDGSMGRLCMLKGVPEDDRLWSARGLVEEKYHHVIVEAHMEYIRAGSTMITTNNYAVQPAYYRRVFEDWKERIPVDSELAARLAVDARQRCGADKTVRVFGSLPPICESHRPELTAKFIEEEGEDFCREYYRTVAEALLRGGADALIAETMNSWDEARLVIEATKDLGAPLIVSMEGALRSLELKAQPNLAPELAERILEARAAGAPIEALGFNCAPPEDIVAALRTLEDSGLNSRLKLAGIRIAVYANCNDRKAVHDAGFDVQKFRSAGPIRVRKDLKGAGYVAWCHEFLRAGADYCGGCCGCTPVEIGQLQSSLLDDVICDVCDSGEALRTANDSSVSTTASDRDVRSGVVHSLFAKTASFAPAPRLAPALAAAAEGQVCAGRGEEEEADEVSVMDGSMGRLCMIKGVPEDDRLWSARGLVEEKYHEIVIEAHMEYIEAGSSMITTNNYAVQPNYYRRVFDDWEQRIPLDTELAARLAFEARRRCGATGKVRILGSLPPICESHRPELTAKFLAEEGEERCRGFYRTTAQALLRGGADALLAETMNSWDEAKLAIEAAKDLGVPLLISMEGALRSLQLKAQPRLAPEIAGKILAAKAAGAPIEALGFNCAPPEDILAALLALEESGLRARLKSAGVRLAVYPNCNDRKAVHDAGFDVQKFASAGPIRVREDLKGSGYVAWSHRFVRAGVDYCGGCCGSTPAEIGELFTSFKERAAARRSAVAAAGTAKEPEANRAAERILDEAGAAAVEGVAC